MTTKDTGQVYVFEKLEKSCLEHRVFSSARWVKNELKRIREQREELVKEHEFLTSVLKDCRDKWSNILDFGGSLGAASYALNTEFSEKEFTYTVLETSEICEAGKIIHDASNVLFLDSLDKIENKIDVVYLRTSLQYTLCWKKTLLSLCNLSPRMLVFDHLSSGEVSTTQIAQNYYGLKIPYWVISSDELTSALSGMGYKCNDIEKCQDFSIDMFDPGVPEKSRIRHSIRLIATRKNI